MNHSELIEKLLKAYEVYYNVNRETPEAPFFAEAVFHSHDEQYFLIRSARISETETHEYVYFADTETLDAKQLQTLADTAWERGLSNVKPHKDHQSSDISLILLADQISEDVKKELPKLKKYKSYRFSLHGWSHFRLIALEVSTGKLIHNRQGESLKKLLGNIYSTAAPKMV